VKNGGGYNDSPLFAELYDYVPGYANRNDRDFYVEYCRESRGEILELGCGTGRILIPAAEAGKKITGVDLSEYMLARCREKLRQKPEKIRKNVRLIHGNIISFKIEARFDLIIIPFRVFQHLIEVDDQMSCLERVRSHLTSDGKLIIDFFNVDPKQIYSPEFKEEMEDVADVKLPNGRRMRRTHRVVEFHQERQFKNVEMIYYLTNADGTLERYTHAFPFRYFFRYEVEHLLARCGFKIVNLFGNFDKSPFVSESPEMIFVAQKTE